MGANPSRARTRKRGVGNMVRLSDESARARFADELDRNFSVVASAGSGKTTAITQRVLSIARSVSAAEILPRLVIVTFTNRAADEMQQRTRQILLEEKLGAEVQTAFNRAFFGTIHSFCMKLLTDYGHYLGLPAPLELLSYDNDLWQEFVQGQTHIGHSLGEKNRAALLRLVQARDLMELGRRAGSAVLCVPKLSPCPTLDFPEIYAQTDQVGRDSISKSQAELREWEKRYASDWEYLRWPVCFTAANSKFSDLWTQTFSPLRRWISAAATCVAAEVQRDFLDFRLERGFVTYGDQIALAKELLPEGRKLKDYQKARIEAEYLARWITHAGLRKLSADSWREVAILCPRKAWLQTMAAALRRAGLPVAIQSERDVKGDSPAYAWLTALLTIMTDPLNAYEIVGVLREIFGVSDHDLAVFSEGEKARFRIDEVVSAAGKISSHLRTLAEIRQRAEGLALFDAVALIVEQTRLRERLLLLPATEFGDLARELDALLAQAAEAEASGI